MKISTRFTVAVHTMLCISYFQDSVKLTSEFIAGSTNVNPVIIRKILGQLQNAALVSTVAGVGGSFLKKAPERITLLDIYKAVTPEEDEERSVFNFHPDPNQKCPVGGAIHAVLDPCLENAQHAMESSLAKVTVGQLLAEISGR